MPDVQDQAVALVVDGGDKEAGARTDEVRTMRQRGPGEMGTAS